MSAIKALYENPLFVCAIVSDTHIDIKHPVPAVPMYYLRSALTDCQGSNTPIDLFLVLGDTTSRGNTENWNMAKRCFDKKYPAKEIILTIGNHDCWNDGGYDEAIKEYYKSYKTVCGKAPEKPYFSKTINGYKLISLGNEGEYGCGAIISDEQLAFLDNELKEGTKDGLPVFVFCHQSINFMHGLPVTFDKEVKPDVNPMEGGIGEKSDEVLAILKKYKNVFYFSGHSHMGLAGERTARERGYSSFETDGDIVFTNLPSTACGNHHGEDNSFGCGMMLEVYKNRVVIRPRNFALKKFNKKIAVKNGLPWFEKEIQI